MAYFGHVFAPCKILPIYGPLARMEKPEKQAESAGGRSRVIVGAAWMDTLLPLMASDVWPPNTKFLVVESDWRCYKNDCHCLCAASLLQEKDILPRRDMADVPIFNGSVNQQLRSRKNADSHILKDLLAIWTHASRIKKAPADEERLGGGHGNFVWFSFRQGTATWEHEKHYDFEPRPQEKRQEAVGIGLYMVGVTKEGAHYMLSEKVFFILVFLVFVTCSNFERNA